MAGLKDALLYGVDNNQGTNKRIPGRDYSKEGTIINGVGTVTVGLINKYDDGLIDTNATCRIKVSKNNAVAYRKEPSITSPIIDYLDIGKTFYSNGQKYIKKDDLYWYHIGDLGWVSGDDVFATVQKKEVIYKVNTKNKHTIVYSEPSKNSKFVKTLVENLDLVATEKKKDKNGVTWYKLKKYDGWISEKDLDSKVKEDKWSNYKTDKQKDEEKKAKDDAKKALQDRLNAIAGKEDSEILKMKDLSKWLNSGSKKEQAAKRARLQKYYDDQAAIKYFSKKKYQSDLSSAVSKMFNSSLMGVFGSPYQFDENTDEKLEGTEYGVTYAQKILTRTPLLLITPGKASYMSDFKKSDRWLELSKLLGINATDENDANQVTISDLIGGGTEGQITDSGRYFTFDFAAEEYFKYVNPMCWAGAKFLGIENSKISVYNTSSSKQYKLSEFNWKYAVNSTIKKNIRAQESISFYVDSYTSSDEDFSNTTTESQIASKVNSFADIGRELQFLMGTSTGEVPDWMQPNNLESTLADMQEMSEKYLGGHQLLIDLAKNFATVATGGQLLFPEIWADHEYSKSYSVTLKLRTPDNDLLSWYLNIYVPLCHLVALTAPRQVSSDVANGYMSPFLIRAYLKGAFNCDCGIVTSLSISRGKEGSWTVNGLPTEVDVNMSFKDLYSMIILTQSDKTSWFMANTALMDYIACNCGVNINEPDIQRQLTMYFSLKKNQYLQLPNRTWGMFTQELSNKISNMYSKFGL